jgi:hypothetical protein
VEDMAFYSVLRGQDVIQGSLDGSENVIVCGGFWHPTEEGVSGPSSVVRTYTQ